MSRLTQVTKKHWLHSLSKERIWTSLITFLPAIIVMAVIFYFSSCDGTESAQTSSRAVDFIVVALQKLPALSLSPEETKELAEALTYPIRKFAHMAEYGILAWCFFLGIYNLVKWYPYIPAFICTFLYAGTDEFHQLYVQGRTGRVSDVLIDSIGALIALLILNFILRRINHGREVHKK